MTSPESPSHDRHALFKAFLAKKGMTSGPTGIPRRDRDSLPRLSFAQERLWAMDRMAEGASGYTFVHAIRLHGALNEECLQLAFQDVVERHEILRTAIVETGDGPRQRVFSAVPLDWTRRDFSQEEDSGAKSLARFARTEGARGFDLTRAPLFRIALIRLGVNEHAVVLSLHHVIYDGWSLGVLCRELDVCYRARLEGQPPELPPLAAQFGDYAEWQRNEMARQIAEGLDHWRDALSGDLPVLDMPSDRQRPPVVEFAGALAPYETEIELVPRLHALAKTAGTTPFTVALAAWAVLLGRTTGADDLIIGVPWGGRSRSELEGLIGFFVNTLPLRVDLSGNPSVLDLLKRLKTAIAKSLDAAEVPFGQIVDEIKPSRDPSRHTLFQTMLVAVDQPDLPETLGDLTLHLEDLDAGFSAVDLTLHLTDLARWSGYLEYRTSLFDRPEVDAVGARFEQTLRALADGPDVPIGDLLIEPPMETARRTVFEQADVALPAVPFRPVHELIQDRVVSEGVGLAVRGSVSTPTGDAQSPAKQALTYRELGALSDALAHRLHQEGVRRGDIVALQVPPSYAMAVGILGILKAGAAYLPLDPAYPQSRRDFMIADSGAKVVVWDGVEPSVKGGLPTVAMGTLTPSGTEPVLPPTDQDDPAYVIYTSGSSGQPKGVVVSHGNLADSTRARRSFYKEPVGAYLLLSSYSFDSSVAGIFWTLCDGGTLVLPTADELLDIDVLTDLIEDGNVTHLLGLPSLYRLLLTHGSADQLKTLEVAIVAGESCPPTLRALSHRCLPHVRLFNEYGPTETTVWSSAAELTGNGDLVTIGRPAPHCSVHILNEDGVPVLLGSVGEIVVGGPGVTKGYLRRDDLTAQRFLMRPELGGRVYRTGDLARFRRDGQIEFLGRLDRQVKVRGHRVELDEIEATISELPGVVEVAALLVEGDGKAGSSKDELIAFVKGDFREDGVARLQAATASRLPRPMIPSLRVLSDLPRTPNGKVDRQALAKLAREKRSVPDLATRRTDSLTPGTGPEAVLRRIWAVSLGLESVEIDDNFFELGGNSILSIEIVAKARGEGVWITPRELFQHQTIAGLLTSRDQGRSSGTI